MTTVVFERQVSFGWRALLDFLPPGTAGAADRMGQVIQGSTTVWVVRGTAAAGEYAGWTIRFRPTPGQSFSDVQGGFPPEGVDQAEVRDAQGQLVATFTMLFQDGGLRFGTVQGDWFSASDQFTGSSVADVIETGAGHDIIWGLAGADQLSGGAGNDSLYGGIGADILNGGTGQDNAVYDFYSFQVTWTRSGDTVTVTSPDGVDTLTGVELLVFNDRSVEIGVPEIETTTSSDVIVLPHSTGETVIPSSEGDDFYFWSGAGTVRGDANDAGIDTFLTQGSVSLETLPGVENLMARWNPAVTSYPVYPTSGFVYGLWLPAGPAYWGLPSGPLNLTGNTLDNMIIGGSGSDVIRGLGGHDRLFGYDGDDRIEGGAGNDWIEGGRGADRLFGGEGSDTFAISYYGNRHHNPGADIIEDFNPLQDRLYFDGRSVLDAWDQYLTWTQVGADTVISHMGGTVTLRNVSASQLTSANVIEGAPSLGFASDRVQVEVIDSEFTGSNGNNPDLWDYFGLDGLTHPISQVQVSTSTPDFLELRVIFYQASMVMWVKFWREPSTGYVTAISIHDDLAAQNVWISNIGGLQLTADDIIADPSLVFAQGVDIRGETGSNVMRTGDGGDSLVGGWNDDHLDAGRGDADIDGKQGTDWARIDFSDRSQGLVFDHNTSLATALVGGVSAARLRSIERVEVVGTAHRDEISGSSLDDVLDLGRGGGFADGRGGDDFVRADLSDQTTGLTYTHSADAAVRRGSESLVSIRNAERVGLIGGSGADLFTGGAGADRFDGGLGDDVLDGGGGDDTFILSGGLDRLVGGEGADTLIYAGPVGMTIDLILTTEQDTGAGRVILASVENVTLTGPSGATVRGSASANLIMTGSGDDWISSGDGDDDIFSGAGDAYIEAGSGDDYVFAGWQDVGFWRPGTGDHEVWLGSGNDTFVGSLGDDIVQGGDGGDSVTDEGGHNRFYGGDGDDSANYGGGDDWADLGDATGRQSFQGGHGDDYVRVGNGGYATLAGAAGDDELHGGDGNDSLVGDDVYDVLELQGSDRLFGYDGADVIEGYFGDDWINGGNGRDRLVGGAGFDIADYDGHSTAVTVDLEMMYDYPGSPNPDYLDGFEGLNGSQFGDSLSGANGANHLFGQVGSDILVGRGGDDLLDGGSGDDQIDGGSGNDVARFSGARSAYTITQDGEWMVITGPDGVDRLRGVEILHFTDGAVAAQGGAIVPGTAGDDTLSGGPSGELLLGVGGDDSLNGGAGDDVLVGGEGFDILTGGAGADEFRFDYRSESWAGSPDFITDFESGADRIVVNDAGHNTLIYYSNGQSQVFFDPVYFSGSPMDPNPPPPPFGYRFEYGGTLDYHQRIIVDGHVAATDVVRNGGTLYLYGDASAQTIRGSAEREFIDGWSGDDILLGLGGDDILHGWYGDDVLEGGAGADEIDGSIGSDTASYAGSGAGVTARLDGVASSGGDAAGDILLYMENLRGSAFNDILIGSSEGNRLEGLAGNDTLNGGAGADVLDGGAGTDRVAYSTSSAGVVARLDGGTSTGGDAQGDVLISIENLTGSAHADTLYGSNGANLLQGYDGNDVLIGGLGADRLEGGAGIDRASYAFSTSGVTVRLDGGTGVGGEAQGDVLVDIENLTGSAQADHLTGSAVANSLSGGLGDDTLDGGEGDDVLEGGYGRNSLTGGAGEDVAVYAGRMQDYVITYQGNTARIVGKGIDDTLRDVELMRFSDGSVEFGLIVCEPGAGGAQAKPASPSVLPPLEVEPDPLVLPGAFEGKAKADDEPVICPPGDEALPLARPEWDLAEMGLSDFGGRDPHRVPATVDWLL